MNFLNSAFLAGLAAALIPLLIHLLNRRRLKTIEFSSVMFLRDLRKTRMRRVRLRRWLLLLIRTLLIATAVLAFARPALRGGLFAAFGSRARTTAVFAIDRSASMALETANGTAYARALSRVNEIKDVWGEGDEAIMFPFDAPSPAELPEPRADLDALLDEIGNRDVGAGGTDAGAALNTAIAAVADARNLNREIYLFTDFRREGLVRTPVTPPASDDNAVTIYCVDVSEAGGIDLGVSDVTPANQLIEPGSPFALSASVRNYNDNPVDRLLVSLFVDGRRVSQRETSVAADGTVTVEFNAIVETAGIHEGFVEISADDNPVNNRRYFTIGIPETIDVLLASDYPSGRLATALALRPQGTADARMNLTAIGSDELIRENLFDYDCVLVTAWRAPQAAVIDHLLRYVRAGGGVFVAPAFDADTTAWNDLIATPHFGLRMGPPPAPPEPDRYFVWERFDWNHPIWSVYADVDRDRIPEIEWHAIFRTEGTHTQNAIVNFSGGRPSLSEARLGTGKLMVLWSPLNPPYSNLALRSLFVPFANRLAEYLAADLSERRSDFAIGEPISREPAQVLPPDVVLTVVAPDGTEIRPGLERDATKTRVSLGGLEVPGVYRIETRGTDQRVIDAFSVNTEPAEMQPEMISREELARRLAGYNLVFVDPGQPLNTAVNQTRYGTEIRPAFLWAVALLFFLEMWLARSRRRDMPLPSGTGAPAAVTAD